MKVVLISTYELGRQPFGLASPAAWLERSGAQVTCFDLAVETLEEEAVAVADVVAFYVPMHTALKHNYSIEVEPSPLVVISGDGVSEIAIGDWGPNIVQFQSFERFRRSLRDPEIITYDELYERARMVLELEDS